MAEIDSSINDIKRLIETLNELHGKLEGASAQAQKLSELITQLAQVNEATAGLSRLADQARKVTEAIESGTGGRFRLGEMGRFRFTRAVSQAGMEQQQPTGDVQEILNSMTARLEPAGGRGAGNLEEFTERLKSLGLSAKAVDDILKRMGETTGNMSVNSREGTKGFDTLTITFKNAAGAGRSFTQRIDSVTRSLVEMGQAAQGRAVNPLTQLARDLEAAGLSLEQRRGLFKELQGVVRPAEVTGVGRVSVTPKVGVEGVEGEFTKVSTSVKVGEQAFISFNKVVTNTGAVLNELPKAAKATSVSVEELTQALGGQAAISDKALAAANKYGFSQQQLRSVTTEASTGITKLGFEMDKQGEVTQRLTLFVDKFGNVLTDTQKRFRGFAEGVIRNTAEAFKWMVAIQLTYAPLRKLQELIETAIKNEAELANIGIVLGKSQEELGAVFDAASQAAAATGENISGVLESYVQAFRATGNIEEANKRSAVAQQLLIDALILSKLSALDEAGAMDTLVGALNQVGLELDQGVVLLDKWVAVSKTANVDVKTLAESFAITSTSASNAGISFDELNGIIATVAESTTLSATEAGNAVRAFISGIQTQKAQETLSQFGISVRDSMGEARGFFDIMTEISSLRLEGLIDDAQLNKIGEALGGGARRGAQYVAFLENLGRVQEVAAISAEAQGDAYAAIDIQLETAQTKITELSNAFQVLAQTLGTDGGVLDIFKLVLEIAQDIVSVVTEMTKALGGLTPFLAVGGALLSYAGATGRLTGGPGGGLYQKFGNAAAGLPFAGALSQRLPQQAQNFPGTQMLQGTWATGGNQVANRIAANAPLIGVALAEALWAGTNALQGDWNGLFGQILGGAFGAVAGGPYGALIGSAIGETLVSYILTQRGDFQSLLTPIRLPAPTPEPEEATKESRLEEIRADQVEIAKQIVQEAGGQFDVTAREVSIRFDEFWRRIFGQEAQIDTSKLDSVSLALDILKERLVGLESKRGKIEPITGFDYGSEADKIKALIAQIEELQLAEENVSRGLEPPEPESTPFSREVSQAGEEYGNLLRTQIISQQKEFFDQLNRGEITSKAYTESLKNIANGGILIKQVFTAVRGEMGNNEETFRRVFEVMATSSGEQIGVITQLKSEVADLTNNLEILSDLEGLTPEQLDIESVRETLEDLGVILVDTTGESRDFTDILKQLDQIRIDIPHNLDEVQAELAATINGIYELNRAAQLQQALQVPVDVDVRSLDEFDLIVEEAMNQARNSIQEQIKLGLLPDDATVSEVLATFEEIFVKIGELGYTTLKIDPAFLRAAKETLSETGKITDPSKFSVKEFDTTQAAFQASYDKTFNFLKESFGDLFQPDLQPVGAIFTDGVDVLHLDNLVMQLAMQELIDVNQKQLEGVYNLPTDASFFVPFQGYKLGFDGAGGGGGAASQGLGEAADELKGAALALKNSAQVQSDFRQQPAQSADTADVNEALRQYFGRGPEGPPALTGTEDPLEDIKRWRAAQQETFPTGPRFDEPVTEPSLFERSFEGFLSTFEQIFQGFLNLFPGINEGAGFQDLDTSNFNSTLESLNQKIQTIGEVSTNLSINSTTSVQLVVDGRTLAQVIKPYFYEDMLRFEAAAGSVTKNVVV